MTVPPGCRSWQSGTRASAWRGGWLWGDAVSHGASFEHFLVFLSGRDPLYGTVREEVKHCRGEMLACTGGINLQNMLPRSIFKASLLTGVKRG